MPFQFNSQGLGTGIVPSASPAFLGTGTRDPSEFALFSGAMNDSPLEFNKSKASSRSVEDKDDASQSPSDKRTRASIRSNRDRRDTEKSHDSDSNMSNSQDVVPIPNGPGLGPANMWAQPICGMGYPMVGMNMIMDPNMMSMNNYGMMPPMIAPDPNMMTPDPAMMINPVKEIIHCKSCTLFPPNPNAPLPTTRERPPGCRTVFVGGLPENMTEDIITEIFERCGEITTLRLSKKNFCHIRFVYEASVDAAIFLSGYRVRIGSNADTANTGRLHVDYAQARDDQYEWECRQRQLQREQRHRERMEEERLRPPSPPPVVHYTDHEAGSVSEKIKQDDSFTKAVQIVITWLERGDCNKRNANNFYSMIQSTNSHVRRLLNEKTQYEEELKKAKDIMKGRMQGILLQFSQIERLFLAACHKKVWDHFTKAQRKNIETWKKQSLFTVKTTVDNVSKQYWNCQNCHNKPDEGKRDNSSTAKLIEQCDCRKEIKNIQLEESGNEKDDDEMDVSDDDEPLKKKQRTEAATEEKNNLREENDSLRCQMEAYKNEVEVLKMDYKKDMEEKDKQFKMLQQTLHGMQQQLIDAKRKQTEEETKVKELQTKLKSDNKGKHLNDKDVITLDDSENEQSDSVSMTESSTETIQNFNECDAKLIGVISAFLNVHPFGAGLDYIWSYVSKIESSLRPSEIESLMNRFPTVFKQELVGIGANIERKWIFNAFNSTASSSTSTSH